LIALVGVALAALAGCAPGQRLLHARIEQEGQVVLETQFAVPDGWDKLTAWRRLESQSFAEVGKVTPDPGTSGRVTLKGKIRVALIHVDRPFAAAEVEELQLVADPSRDGHWRLAPAEAARTQKAVQ
jgi:hypothetical protein